MKNHYLLIVLVYYACFWLPPVNSAEKKELPKTVSVNWRTDYNEARKEAAKTGRPMFLYFMTDISFHCRKFEQVTLSQSKVAKLLNEKYVPLRMDIKQSESRSLVAALRITASPTCILAKPDGKIMAYVEGYKDEAGMMEVLEGSLGRKVENSPKSLTGPQAQAPF